MAAVTYDDAIYGAMSVQAGAAGEATVDATPRQLAAWNTNGLNNLTTVDHTADEIVVDEAGTYMVKACVSFSGTASKTFQLEFYKYDASASPLVYSASGHAVDRKLGAGGDVGACSLHGIIAFSAGDKIAIFQSSSDGGTALTVTEAQLSIYRIST